MTDVTFVWNDQAETISNAFDSQSDFLLNQLQTELRVENSSVELRYSQFETSIWADGVPFAMSADTIYAWIDGVYDSGEASAFADIVASHVPADPAVIPDNFRRMFFDGLTDGSGNFTVAYDSQLDEPAEVIPTIGDGFDLAVARVVDNTVNGFTVNVKRPSISELVIVSANVSSCPVSVAVIVKN